MDFLSVQYLDIYTRGAVHAGVCFCFRFGDRARERGDSKAVWLIV